MSDNKKQTNFEINQVINKSYKYGFSTNIESEKFPIGINEDIVQLISRKKNEPDFLKKFRLKAYQNWKKLKTPLWANLNISEIDYNNIIYYSIPKQKKTLASLEEVDPEILKTFEKLGISLEEQKKLSNVASCCNVIITLQ